MTEVSYCKPLSKIVLAIVPLTVRFAEDIDELTDRLATFAWSSFSVTEDAFNLAKKTDDPNAARLEALALSEVAQPIFFELRKLIRHLFDLDMLGLLKKSEAGRE